MNPPDVRFDQARGLLAALAMGNCRIRRDGRKLVVTAPRGALTLADRRELAAYKAELLTLIEEDKIPWGDAS